MIAGDLLSLASISQNWVWLVVKMNENKKKIKKKNIFNVQNLVEFHVFTSILLGKQLHWFYKTITGVFHIFFSLCFVSFFFLFQNVQFSLFFLPVKRPWIQCDIWSQRLKIFVCYSLTVFYIFSFTSFFCFFFFFVFLFISPHWWFSLFQFKSEYNCIPCQ